MSPSKKDQTFPPFCDLKSDAELAAIIATALRAAYSDKSTAVKYIARDAGVFPRTARNWYEGKNLISIRCLIMLARHREAIRDLVGELCKPEPEDTLKSGTHPPLIEEALQPRKAPSMAKNVPINVLINVQIKSERQHLSIRQIWFIEELCRNVNLAAVDLALEWGVDYKTAYRDIMALRACGLIDRKGSRKSGQYVILAGTNRKP